MKDPIRSETGASTNSYALAAGLALVKLGIHLPLANRYGYFRDELYFFDCGRNLDWGYVDHAPLIGLVYKLMLELGGSLALLRATAALAGAATVALTVLLTGRLGGKAFAKILAGVCVLIAPGFLGGTSLLTMNVFEPLIWTGCAYVLVQIIETGNSRLWVLFGLLAGIGLQNKHSMAFFGAAILAGIVFSPLRREFARGWFWAGGAVAALVFLPNVLWQWQHGFPTLEGLHNVKVSGKNVVLGPLAFIGAQIEGMHPITFPVWLVGLGTLLAGELRRFRVFGVAYLALLAIFIAMAGKSYYLFPIYPVLFASGGVAIASWFGRRAFLSQRLWPSAAVVGLLLAAGAVVAPLALPLHLPENYLAYEKRLGISRHKTEVRHEGPLPQHFGDQFGWEELVADVARIYNALPPEEKAHATIFASNYGEAGALHLFGPKYGLPDAICAHQTHYFWGPKGRRGDVVIFLQWGRSSLERMFASVEEGGKHHHPWGMEEENRPIYVCRGLRVPFEKLWPELKHWN